MGAAAWATASTSTPMPITHPTAAA
jgi:hypothetical protein